MQNNVSKPTQAEMLKAIDKLVRDGKAEHVMIDGKPGIRLIKTEEAKP